MRFKVTVEASTKNGGLTKPDPVTIQLPPEFVGQPFEVRTTLDPNLDVLAIPEFTSLHLMQTVTKDQQAGRFTVDAYCEWRSWDGVPSRYFGSRVNCFAFVPIESRD